MSNRIATANMYDNGLRNIGARQTSLSGLQENLTSGKRVVRASDDPVAAAQAERSLTRISRIQVEQRALEVQRNAIAQAESSLGDAIGLVQNIRELTVSAGNAANSATDRGTIANQIDSLRQQLLDVANRKDANGIPLFNGLGSALAPFLGPQSPAPDYTFEGLPGQTAATSVSVPLSLDGDAAFMFRPQRDGVYHASLSPIPATRQFGTDAVATTNPGLVTGDGYSIAFSAVTPGSLPGTTTSTYTITNTTTGIVSAPVTLTDIPDNQSVAITGVPGLSINIKGTPANGDAVTLEPSASIFSVISRATKEIAGAANSQSAAQAVGQALANIDRGLERLQTVRGNAGELLNRADRISGNQQTRGVQLEGDRSRAEDLDMIQGISDFQNQQVGYEAALKSYAMVQKLSLFNFIS